MSQIRLYLLKAQPTVTTVFYDLWKGAVEGTNGYVPVFIPWFTDPTYREAVPAKFERTPDEEELVKEYGLDDEQLMFRRRKVAQNGIELFMQEYPATPDQAFLTSGRPVFNPEQIQQCLENTQDIEEKLALEGEDWVHNHRGELQTYRKLDGGERYVIGADSSMGIRGGDYSVAQVLDSQKRQVATWRGHVHPDYFAEVLYALGMYYNEAFICVERNSHGILTCTRLGKDMAYPNFYTEVQVDKLTDKETISLGFNTTSKDQTTGYRPASCLYERGRVGTKRQNNPSERCLPTLSPKQVRWKQKQVAMTTA